MSSGVPPTHRRPRPERWRLWWLPKREVIGPPDCPIMYRWTVRPWSDRKRDVRWKLMVHHFLPNSDDRDVHDHPRPFYTLVLWGGYDDIAQCPQCDGAGTFVPTVAAAMCSKCRGAGYVLREAMRPGVVRFRRADHTHRTRTHPTGAWTVVLMGPLERMWGFWRGRQWWAYKDYSAEFGFAMRCEDLPLEYRK